MKDQLIAAVNKLVLFTAFSAMLAACNKRNNYVDTVYPDNAVYLAQSAAATVAPGANGFYTLAANIPNQPQRFSVDLAGGKLTIPLGIIRAGVRTNGAYTISIAANTDTVSKLMALGKFAIASDPAVTTELLPATAYQLPAAVDIADGSLQATFPLSVDLNFLTSSFTADPKKRYVIAVGISSAAKTAVVKPSLSIAVLLIDTRQVIQPQANFNSYVTKDGRTAVFTNTASNGISYSWNFGDGTAAETAVAPSHLYAAAGTYAVTLTVNGVPNSGPAPTRTQNVVIP